MKILGITGKKRSGKDTFCNLLSSVFHSSLNSPRRVVARRAFADPLKEECAKMLGVSLEFLEEHKVSHYRGLLQWWGTEFRREMFRQDYWLQRMAAWLEDAYQRDDADRLVVVVTDCRFPNEADFLKERGATLVKIVRPSLSTEPVDLHPSEALMESIKPDYTILNDGNLEEYHASIEKLAWSL